MVDLRTQYEKIRSEIDDAIFSVISYLPFIFKPIIITSSNFSKNQIIDYFFVWMRILFLILRRFPTGSLM